MTRAALFCFAIATGLALVLFSLGCSSSLKAIHGINETVGKTTAMAMPRWDADCKAKAKACNAAGNTTRETCPALVACEKAQDKAYDVANGIHAAAAAAALAHKAGRPVNLAGVLAKMTAEAGTLYDLLQQAGYLEVFK